MANRAVRTASLPRWGLHVIMEPLSIKIRASNRGRAILSAFITLFGVHPSTVCRQQQRLSISTPTLMGRRSAESLGGADIGEGGKVTWGEQHYEEPVGDGFVILVIKDRVASMPGVRTGCGKLPESLWRKAAPSLLCPFSGDLIIFSNSQDGILYPLFPHLLFPSFCLSFHFLLSPSSWNAFQSLKQHCSFRIVNEHSYCWLKCKTFNSYLCGFFPLKHVFMIKYGFVFTF